MEYDFARIGNRVDIYEPVAIIKPENIHLGSDIILSEFSYINGGLGTYFGSHIHIASQSCISGGGCFIIEDFAGLSAGVKVITGSAKFNGEGLTSPTLPRDFQSVYRSYVIIEKHAVVATNAVIHPGVVIAEGSVISSGSVVTKNTEPWSIYRGVPAVKIKERDSKSVQALEKRVYSELGVEPCDFSELKLKLISQK